MKNSTKLLIVIGLALVLMAGLALAKSRTSKSAWLGVFTQTVDKELAKTFDLDANYGAIVNEVVDDSPADRAGLRKDDIIIAVNGTKIDDADELTEQIQSATPGDKVVLTVNRDGREMDLKTTLEPRVNGIGRDNDSDNGTGEENNDNDYYKGAYRYQLGPGNDNFTLTVPKGSKGTGKHGVYFFGNDNDRGGYIGVNLIELSDQLASYFGVSDDQGVLVSSVEEDSPAEKAGIKAGDVIISADSEEVEDASDLQRVIRRMDEGDKVDLGIMRDHRKMNLTVEVGERDFGNVHAFTLPDLNINLPQLKKSLKDMDLSWRSADEPYLSNNLNQSEREEFQKQVEDLRQQVKDLKTQLKKELKELHEKIDK